MLRVCVCNEQQEVNEREKERKEHLVSLYFIETPAGGLIKGYATWWESLKEEGNSSVFNF